MGDPCHRQCEDGQATSRPSLVQYFTLVSSPPDLPVTVPSTPIVSYPGTGHQSHQRSPAEAIPGDPACVTPDYSTFQIPASIILIIV